MADAIYATTGSKDWPDAAKRLENEQNIYPRYWITNELKEEVSDRFEDVIIHDSFEAMKGHSAEEYDFESQYYSLNSEILSAFREYEVIALKMMDRLYNLDNTRGEPKYRDRMRLYYQQLSYWIYVIDDVDPDVCIFGSTPHLVYDYILYAVCASSDVKTIIGTHTNLPNRFCVRNRIDEDPIHINNRDRSSNKISKELKEYIQKLRGKYKEAEPDYMKNDIQREEYKKMEIYDRIQTASQLLSKFFIMIEKKMRHYITTGMSRNPNIKMRILRKINRTYYRKKLRSRYETHVVEPDYSLNYLYFPLHYQPERTTSPEGGRFVHQYLAIDLLSSVLPNNTHIFVKEHPSQFSSRLQGEKGRSLQYYNHIRDIPKVSLVPLDSDPFELIDNSKAVATITGTAGWEALVRGKPAIIFGNAWYRSAPGCHHIDEIKGSANVVKDIINSEGVSRECINNFVSRAEEACYLGSLNSTSEGNVDALFDAVSDLM